MTADLLSFPWRSAGLSSRQARAAAKTILATSISERLSRPDDHHLEDPEQLLSVCDLLRRDLEVAPAHVRSESDFFYTFLERPYRRIGRFDEREYYLGEFALLAGTACRFLALRDEAKTWFGRSEANFVLAHNASAHIARVAYQRLALCVEARQFDEVTEFAPRWFSVFEKLSLPEDALKCRFLEAHALKETDRLEDAKRAFLEIRQEAGKLGNPLLEAIASQNLFQIHVFLQEPEQAIARAREAAPVFKRLNNRVNSAKLQLGIGYLLRSQRKLAEAIAAYRDAQNQFLEIEMHADVAATHLVLADLLLDANQPAQAEWEIRAALPVIDELKLVPEGIAALSLLRDSIRRRQIDRQALRSLNGYLEDLKT